MTKKTRRPRSATMASIHEAAAGLRKVKAIDGATMRAFDALCLASSEVRVPAYDQGLLGNALSKPPPQRSKKSP